MYEQLSDDGGNGQQRPAPPASELRDSLRSSSGDTLFLQFESESGIVRLAKASSPFDVLADEAEKELEAGRTTNIREYARQRGIAPDE